MRVTLGEGVWREGETRVGVSSPTACTVEEQGTQDNRCVARTRDASEAADIAIYPRTESKAGRTLVPHKPICGTSGEDEVE